MGFHLRGLEEQSLESIPGVERVGQRFDQRQVLRPVPRYGRDMTFERFRRTDANGLFPPRLSFMRCQCARPRARQASGVNSSSHHTTRW
jgi:hypothetical protein